MATLTENLTEIKRQKDTYILPENLKKDITVFGVTGTLESGGTITSGIKQFSTVEEMQADPTAKEGDLAIVYRSEIQNATVDSKFQTATFPETVVLDTAIADYIEVRYRAVDSSVMFDCWGQLDSSMFSMDCYSESGEVRIQYESSDGITYTRTDTTGNPVDFGTEIYYAYSEMWNDAIGKFIQVGGNIFEGLFEYCEIDNKDYYSIPYNIDPVNNTYDQQNVNLKQLWDFLDTDTTFQEYYTNNTNNSFIIKYEQIENKQIKRAKVYFVNKSGLSTVYYTELNQRAILTGNTTNVVKVADVDMVNRTITYTEIIPTRVGMTWTDSSGVTNYNYVDTYENNTIISTCNSRIPHIVSTENCWVTTNIGAERTKCFQFNVTREPELQLVWKDADTQLNVTSDYVCEKEFYGKNGVEIGTLTQDVSNSFADTNAEVYNKIQNAYDNMEPRVLTDDDKAIDKNIYFIPVKNNGTILLDTSNLTNMQSIFSGCTNLTTIPLLNTGSVTNMQYMFSGCTNLTTIPLLDIGSVANISYMFQNCTNLTEIPLLNTSNATDMYDMFNGCTNLKTIPLLDTGSATNMYEMFHNCTNLTEIPVLNTSSVTNMQHMFSGCASLTTIPLLDTSRVTSMYSMFYCCTNLTKIPQLDTSKVTNMSYMFSSCINLPTIPQLNTSSATNMYKMFHNCTNLTEIPVLNTSRVTNMSVMFSYCKNLTTIPQLDTSSATNMSYMFDTCTNLTEIPQLNTSKVTNIHSMFSYCRNLTTIPVLNTSKVTDMGYMVSGCTNLSDESLNNILAMCTNATSYTDTKTLRYVGLTSEQAIKCTTLSNYSAFTSAGWTTGY